MKHNALFEIDPPDNNPKILPGTVGVIVKSGWIRQNTLLRAANVGVIKQSKKDTPNNHVKSE